MSRFVFLVDIGSTYTKAVLVDRNAEAIVTTAKSPTTVATDISIGLENALAMIEATVGGVNSADILACCSAAGGLRMVSVGLVPDLSSEAARRAALGAGAKMVGHYSHRLSAGEISAIVQTGPDVILLAGGTDGGDERTILHNARLLAQSSLAAPMVVAGNKCVQGDVGDLLSQAGKTHQLVANVMPEIGRLEVGPCRDAIRQVFITNIVKAKGLDRAERLVGNILMATPDAVLNAATLLAQGIEGEDGLGELVMVDVGGATTDVYSIAMGTPTNASVVMPGLPEPFSKRTVEGDLGVRHNIDILAELCRSRDMALDEGVVAAFLSDPGRLPATMAERAVDEALTRMAVKTSFERHVGRIETIYGPHGEAMVQTGKDLRGVATIIGTGGPIACSDRPRDLLRGVLANGADTILLKPEQARIYVDDRYIMYAMGLLAQAEPLVSLRIMKGYIHPV